jgi:hypothetical protein
MSIYSDVFITKQQAKEMVKARLMYHQERIINLAIKSMDNWELANHLNSDGSDYYYNIKEEVLDENNR